MSTELKTELLFRLQRIRQNYVDSGRLAPDFPNKHYLQQVYEFFETHYPFQTPAFINTQNAVLALATQELQVSENDNLCVFYHSCEPSVAATYVALRYIAQKQMDWTVNDGDRTSDFLLPVCLRLDEALFHQLPFQSALEACSSGASIESMPPLNQDLLFPPQNEASQLDSSSVLRQVLVSAFAGFFHDRYTNFVMSKTRRGFPKGNFKPWKGLVSVWNHAWGDLKHVSQRLQAFVKNHVPLDLSGVLVQIIVENDLTMCCKAKCAKAETPYRCDFRLWQARIYAEPERFKMPPNTASIALWDGYQWLRQLQDHLPIIFEWKAMSPSAAPKSRGMSLTRRLGLALTLLSAGSLLVPVSPHHTEKAIASEPMTLADTWEHYQRMARRKKEVPDDLDESKATMDMKELFSSLDSVQKKDLSEELQLRKSLRDLRSSQDSIFQQVGRYYNENVLTLKVSSILVIFLFWTGQLLESSFTQRLPNAIWLDEAHLFQQSFRWKLEDHLSVGFLQEEALVFRGQYKEDRPCENNENIFYCGNLFTAALYGQVAFPYLVNSSGMPSKLIPNVSDWHGQICSYTVPMGTRILYLNAACMKELKESIPEAHEALSLLFQDEAPDSQNHSGLVRLARPTRNGKRIEPEVFSEVQRLLLSRDIDGLLVPAMPSSDLEIRLTNYPHQEGPFTWQHSELILWNKKRWPKVYHYWHAVDFEPLRRVLRFYFLEKKEPHELMKFLDDELRKMAAHIPRERED